MYIRLIYFITGIICLGTSWSCRISQQNQVSQGNNSTAITDTIQTSDRSKTNRPATKTVTITVEGEKTPLLLKLYEEYRDLFTTYFPEQDFLAEGISSGEGTGVRFIANFGGSKNENAYVSFSFLNGIKSIEQLRKFVNGKSGLITSNGWRVVSRTQKVSYSWAKEKIVFRKGQDITGTVYLGQQNGRVFYAIAHYPVEYGDGFPPRSNLILQNLQVASQ